MNEEHIKAERVFLHDLSNAITITDGGIRRCLKAMSKVEDPSINSEYVKYLETSQKKMKIMITLLNDRRNALIALSQ